MPLANGPATFEQVGRRDRLFRESRRIRTAVTMARQLATPQSRGFKHALIAESRLLIRLLARGLTLGLFLLTQARVTLLGHTRESIHVHTRFRSSLAGRYS